MSDRVLRRRETPSPRPSSSSSGPGFVPFQLSDEQYASVCPFLLVKRCKRRGLD